MELVVESIVTKSIVNNAKKRITGALVLTMKKQQQGGEDIVQVLQVLEGGKKEVMELYNSIIKDKV